MKKILFAASFIGLLTACQNDDNSHANKQEDVNNVENFQRRSCPSEEIRSKALAENPVLRERLQQIEAKTAQFENDLSMGKVLADGSVEIPVVVNVLYSTSAQNLSDARIAEQISVLNADYGGTNSDATQIPTEFNNVKAGDTKVRFRLANVIRKSTTISSWSPSQNYMKRSANGGIDATNPSQYLNIWVVGSMGGVLGYATFPESSGLWNDGVVIAAPYFGKSGASAPFNLGRTATHEVGHYLNLRHIWGDARCGNDQVADTPTQTKENYGTPSYPLYNRCNGTNRSVMFMNYMDYVDDKAMFMFSAGQKTRMQAVVAANGSRAGLRMN